MTVTATRISCFWLFTVTDGLQIRLTFKVKLIVEQQKLQISHLYGYSRSTFVVRLGNLLPIKCILWLPRLQYLLQKLTTCYIYLRKTCKIS